MIANPSLALAESMPHDVLNSSHLVAPTPTPDPGVENDPGPLVLRQPSRHDRIADRAYELYLERGGAPGHDFDDWLQAEREIDTDSDTRP